MITNLVFKRTVNIEGSQKTEMKIIKVEIDGIRASEGWTLVENVDQVAFADQPLLKGERILVDKLPERLLT